MRNYCLLLTFDSCSLSFRSTQTIAIFYSYLFSSLRFEKKEKEEKRKKGGKGGGGGGGKTNLRSEKLRPRINIYTNISSMLHSLRYVDKHAEKKYFITNRMKRENNNNNKDK